MLEHLHHNRILQIIKNKDNTASHLMAVRNLLTNYRNQFGITKLYLGLLLKQTELIQNV